MSTAMHPQSKHKEMQSRSDVVAAISGVELTVPLRIAL